MTGVLSLDEDAVRDFVGPGTSTALLDALAKSQIRKRLLQLAYVARRVRRDTPELYVHSGLRDAYELLIRSSPDDVDAVAAYPSFGRWCAVAERFIDKESHVTLPAGQVASHLALLGSFAIVAAARSRDAELDLQFGADGRICLPTLRLVVDGGLEFAGKSARCALGPDGIPKFLAEGRALALDGTGQSSSGCDLRLRTLPDAAGHLEVNDADPLLRVGYAGEDFEQIAGEAARRWRATLESAFTALRRILPAGAGEVERSVRVLVPLVTRTSGVHRSAASADASGMVQMSWSASGHQIAEALLHEYYHTKLNALLDLAPVFVGDDGAEDYYSPWRDDPRPLRGVLHGVFSFYIVTFFWHHAYAARPDADVNVHHALREAVRRRRQVRIAIEQLKSHATLTQAGSVLLDEIQKRVDECDLDTDADPAMDREIDRQLSEHQANWHARRQAREGRSAEQMARLDALWSAVGGAARAVPRGCALVPMGAASRDAWAALGMDRPLEVNRVADHLSRRDLSFDMLGRLSVVAPDRFHEIVGTLGTGDPDDILAEFLSGHAAYIAGGYEDAARHYGRCLHAVPGNLDMWRDFAFTLRHLGMRFECDAFLFRPGLVADFAEGHALDPRVFERLGVWPAEPGGPDADQWLVQRLLLRWIGEETR